MSRRLVLASFAGPNELLGAVAASRKRDWPVVEAFTPYAVHGLDEALGYRRTRLAAACFVCGLLGVALALGFQFWSTARSWPLNVGGQPWNSLPAFVPVTFETMVLCAGLGVVLALLLRARLYPGKQPFLPGLGETDDRFVLVLGEFSPAEDTANVRRLLQEWGAITVEEREQ
jgi:hypothetical protein